MKKTNKQTKTGTKTTAKTKLKGGKRVNTKRMDHPPYLYESTVIIITAIETNPCKTKSNSRWHSYKHRFMKESFFLVVFLLFSVCIVTTFFLYLMLNTLFYI